MVFSPREMHIPDGFLTPPVAIVGWALALLMVAVAVRQTRRQLGERQIPLMGVLAAFIFAAQAVNFPVAAGTSGHLLGATLAAVVMGPWAGMLIMTAVIAVQGLLFQDGGLLVMGWNIVNMGILTAFSGYGVYQLVKRIAGERPAGRLAAALAGAWLSVEVGAAATAVELALSGTTPLRLGLPAMVGVHALIGIGEGVITASALAFLHAARPEVLAAGESAPGRRGAAATMVGLLIALAVAALSPLASPNPDGLEAVAEGQGFLGLSLPAAFEVLPDYAIPSVENPWITTFLAVGLGTLLVFGVAFLIGRATGRRAGSED